jgi:hypothetical protein
MGIQEFTLAQDDVRSYPTMVSPLVRLPSDKDSTVDNGGQRVSRDGKLSKVRSSASVKNLTGIRSLLPTMVFTH